MAALCRDTRLDLQAAHPGALSVCVHLLVEVFCVSPLCLLVRSEAPSTKEPVCWCDKRNVFAREQIFAKYSPNGSTVEL